MPSGLRERKKEETRRALADAALDLVSWHGLDAVTIDEIADAAHVSVRTFFNYFSCKEEAVVGLDPSVVQDAADRLRGRPAGELPLQALRAVLLGKPDLNEVLERWKRRTELVQQYPALQARHLAVLTELEHALAEAIGERLGVNPATDPTPRATVAAVLAAVRATLDWWVSSNRRTGLVTALERTFHNLSTTLAPVATPYPSSVAAAPRKTRS